MTRLIVVSGRSGSGKSAALGSLEDAGYTCVDNLPVAVLIETVNILSDRTAHPQIAVGIDARSQARDIAALSGELTKLKDAGVECRVIWLDASLESLMARFHATRRRHPLLGNSGSLEQALNSESNLLEPIHQLADRHLDTTQLSVHELRSTILSQADPHYAPARPAIHLMSFGFKHGAPSGVDYLVDARFLPNPYWQAELRMQTGRDKAVQDFLKTQPDSQDYLDDLEHLLRRWAPKISQSGRPSVTLAVGCTGGQHRSVFLVETLRDRLARDFEISYRHRELET
jgi:UPF0042 nucleotide-binding protein